MIPPRPGFRHVNRTRTGSAPSVQTSRGPGISTPGRSGDDLRVVRGGHWLNPPERRTMQERQEVGVAKRSPTLGFRCARSIAP